MIDANSRVFITGGSGTLGRELVGILHKRVRQVVVYSRTEDKQLSMQQDYPEYPDNKIRYLLGDICDEERLRRAMEGSHVVIHTAAMKMIDRCEYNPTEAVRINLQGTMNVARACSDMRIRDAMFISTDKATLPISLYGFTKATAERAWVDYNNMSACRFNCVRYGNVAGSAKSVFHTWKWMAQQGKDLMICHPDMTRFFWTIQQAAQFCVNRIDDAHDRTERGMVYVPKMRSYKMMTVATDILNKYGSTSKIYKGEFRCLEKIHEDLISVHESPWVTDVGDHYLIYPSRPDWGGGDARRGTPVPEGFSLSSRGVIE